MALAGGGGASAAADAGLRLAVLPPSLPPSAAAAPSGPPPPPRAPPASQPGGRPGDSPTPPTPIPPRGRGSSAQRLRAPALLAGRTDGLSGSARRGSARLRSTPLPPPLLLLLPRRLRPTPHTLAPCPPPRARSGGGFRLGPPARRGARRGSHVFTPATPLPAQPSPGSDLFSPAPCQREKGPLGGHFETGHAQERESPTAATGALPETKMADDSDGLNEAATTPLPFCGAILGTSLVLRVLRIPMNAMALYAPSARPLTQLACERPAGQGDWGPAAGPGPPLARGR